MVKEHEGGESMTDRNDEPLGVLVLSYGSPRDLEDVERYYKDIAKGHPPTKEMVEELRMRYVAVGGTTALTMHTAEQASALADYLKKASPRPVAVAQGTKHSFPTIEQGLSELSSMGVRQGIAIVAAPHFSEMSVGQYRDRVLEASRNITPPMEMKVVTSWHLQSDLLDLLAAEVRETLARMPDPETTMVLFSAHSLPERILASGDPYPGQLLASAQEIATRAGLKRWQLAWQSAGRTREPWLGPDLLQVLEQLVEEGVTGCLVCPQGFVVEHLEILYDLDIVARSRAKELGLAFERTPMPGAHPALIRAMGTAVLELAEQ
jgi:ferrochelatase